MTDTLLILSGDPDGDALLLQRNGMAQRGDADALAAAGNGPLALVLPGQQVRAFLTDMPAKVRAADRDSIARFAHEDRIATDMDALHVVIGRADGDSPGAVQTLMVARADLQAAIERFDPASVFADFDLLSGFGTDPVSLLDRVVTPGPMGEAVDADWSDVAGTLHDDGTL
ncbi:MAG: type II secretion system protein GspL, partial [Litorimonas sp.]